MDINSYKSYPKILVAVDCIIFGFDGRDLKVLLARKENEAQKGKWSFLTGSLQKDESSEMAAARVLLEYTGMTNIYMEQICTFSDINGHEDERVISVSFFALINLRDYAEEHEERRVKWFRLNYVPRIVYDPKKILPNAKQLLREKAANYPIGFQLLPRKFTLQQLHALYEGIFQTSLDKRNFLNKFSSFGILKKLNEKEKNSSRKGAFYYVFDKRKYGNSPSLRIGISRSRMPGVK